MPTNGNEYDVVIVGAGASGLRAAKELARDHRVLLLEAGTVGGGASGHAAGFVSVFDDWVPYPEVVVHSIEGFRAFDGRHGFEFVERPYVELYETAADAEAARDLHRPLFDHPEYGIEYLDADGIEEQWPGLFDLSGFVGGLVKPESGIIDPASYCRALAADVRDRGLEIREQTPVTRILAEDDSVAGVETTDERIPAETVVCAAGAQTPELVAEYVEVPARRFVYSNVRVEVEGEIDEEYPMAYARDLWWRPEPGRSNTFLVSGGTYFLPEGEGPPRNPPSEYFREIERKLPKLARDVDEVRFVTGSDHTCTNGCAVLPDGLPILDEPDEAPDGLVVATAIGAGISTSPFTGAAVRSLVTGEPAPISLEPFSADRFDSPSRDFRIHGIRDMPGEFPSGAY